jgi:hypothetical protein
MEQEIRWDLTEAWFTCYTRLGFWALRAEWGEFYHHRDAVLDRMDELWGVMNDAERHRALEQTRIMPDWVNEYLADFVWGVSPSASEDEFDELEDEDEPRPEHTREPEPQQYSDFEEQPDVEERPDAETSDDEEPDVEEPPHVEAQPDVAEPPHVEAQPDVAEPDVAEPETEPSGVEAHVRLVHGVFNPRLVQGVGVIPRP